MSKRRLVDTNLIIRFLVQDNEEHAQAAGKLFAACDRGEVTVVVLPAVLAECVFVLESFYQHPRQNIARVLSQLLASPGVEIADEDIHRDALERYGSGRLHFVDCVIAAYAAARSLLVATFDSGFRKLSGVQVEVD
jgi:predicted nucleic-acid-binding protein